MIDVEQFREALRAIVATDLPDWAQLPTMWLHLPARAFLRLSDDDQRKVWAFIVAEREAAQEQINLDIAGMSA